jgi:hypothetical protein
MRGLRVLFRVRPRRCVCAPLRSFRELHRLHFAIEGHVDLFERETATEQCKEA